MKKQKEPDVIRLLRMTSALSAYYGIIKVVCWRMNYSGRCSLRTSPITMHAFSITSRGGVE